MTKKPRKKTHMTKEEKEKWDELYEYVRSNVMGYDENMCLSSNMVLRLKGMLNGKFMANNSIENKAHYSYDVVLIAFKYSMPEIRRAMDRVSFSNEMHKFLYIAKIVESNMNDVYIRMKNRKKIEEEVTKEVKNTTVYKTPEFKPTIKKHSKQNKFDDLW